jgi:hypothetical protein
VAPASPNVSWDWLNRSQSSSGRFFHVPLNTQGAFEFWFVQNAP